MFSLIPFLFDFFAPGLLELLTRRSSHHTLILTPGYSSSFPSSSPLSHLRSFLSLFDTTLPFILAIYTLASPHLDLPAPNTSSLRTETMTYLCMCVFLSSSVFHRCLLKH